MRTSNVMNYLFIKTTKLIDWMKMDLSYIIINVRISKSSTRISGNQSIVLRMCGEKGKQEENKLFVATEATTWRNCDCFAVCYIKTITKINKLKNEIEWTRINSDNWNYKCMVQYVMISPESVIWFHMGRLRRLHRCRTKPTIGSCDIYEEEASTITREWPLDDDVMMHKIIWRVDSESPFFVPAELEFDVTLLTGIAESFVMTSSFVKSFPKSSPQWQPWVFVWLCALLDTQVDKYLVNGIICLVCPLSVQITFALLLSIRPYVLDESTVSQKWTSRLLLVKKCKSKHCFK
jgi:hypothetical protein